MTHFIQLIFLIDHCFLNTSCNSCFRFLLWAWKVNLHPCCSFKVGLELSKRPTISKHFSLLFSLYPMRIHFPSHLLFLYICSVFRFNSAGWRILFEGTEQACELHKHRGKTQHSQTAHVMTQVCSLQKKKVKHDICKTKKKGKHFLETHSDRSTLLNSTNIFNWQSN